MTDEEVLKIAQGLSDYDWGVRRALAANPGLTCILFIDSGMTEKGFLHVAGGLAYVTPLGYRVWGWRELFDSKV